MGRYLLKLAENEYIEWSTVVDAPVTYVLSRDDLATYYKDQYGEHGMLTFEQRMERVEAKGTSALLDKSVEETIAGNRAGPDETEISLHEIRLRYRSEATYKTFKRDV